MSAFSGLIVTDHAGRRYVERVIRVVVTPLAIAYAKRRIRDQLLTACTCEPCCESPDTVLQLDYCFAYVRDNHVTTVVSRHQYQSVMYARGRRRKDHT